MKLNILATFGLGKSTIVEAIGKKYNMDIYLEDFETNPYLRQPNGDKTKSQFYFMNNYLRQIKQTINTNNNVVLDASFYSGICYMWYFFINGMISKDDYDTYKERFDLIREIHDLDSKYKSFVLYDNPEVIYERIQKRGRDFEKDVDFDFVKRLNEIFITFAMKNEFDLIHISGLKEHDIPKQIEFYIQSNL